MTPPREEGVELGRVDHAVVVVVHLGEDGLERVARAVLLLDVRRRKPERLMSRCVMVCHGASWCVLLLDVRRRKPERLMMR